MVGHIQHVPAVSLRTRMAEVRERIDAKARNRPARQSSGPLTSEEAELYERLSPVLAKRPRRGMDTDADATPVNELDFTQSLAQAIHHSPLDDDLPLEPPNRLPDVADDPANARPARVHAVNWLKRSKRARVKSALRYSAAWLITIAVIAATVGGGVVALLGVDKAHSAVTTLYGMLPAIMRF